MTLDRLDSYADELKVIRDKFIIFSQEVMTLCLETTVWENCPVSNGAPMNSDWWIQQEKEIQAKVNNHQLLIRNAATALMQNRTMSQFEAQDLELKQKELVLKEKKLQFAEEQIKKALQEEVVKAKALALEKHDEVLALALELEGFVDEIKDWSKATRAEVISTMKSLDKWSDKFSSLNKAYREFNTATSKHKFTDFTTKVEEVMEDIIEKFNKTVESVKKEDKERELFN